MTNGSEFKGSNKQGGTVRWLFNPFYYLAGGRALMLGIGVIVITALIAFQGGMRFDGVVDFHPLAQSGFPLWISLVEGIISWLSIAILLFVSGLIFSRSKVRPVDVFGTQALARVPYLFLACFALWNAPWQYAAQLLPGTVKTSDSASLVLFVFASLLSLLLMAWMIWLMYKAFSHSSNMAGAKAAVIFVICLLAGEALSKTVLIAMSPVSPVPDMTAPQVTETVPSDGATDVDPSLGEIRVAFSEPMRDSCWAWCYEDKNSFPELNGDSYYVENNTVAVLPVKLEPGKEYVIWVNKGRFNAFQDKAGNRVKDFRFTFSTRQE